MQTIDMPSERAIQDYRSTYNDTRDWLRRDKEGQDKDKSTVDWDDVVFEVDLLKSQEINLDYILELIFDHNKKNKIKKNLQSYLVNTWKQKIFYKTTMSLLV